MTCPHCALVITAVWSITTSGDHRNSAVNFFHNALTHCDLVNPTFAARLRLVYQSIVLYHRTVESVPIIARQYMELFDLSRAPFGQCTHADNADLKVAYGLATGVSTIVGNMTAAQSKWFVWIVGEVMRTSQDHSLKAVMIKRFKVILESKLDTRNLLDRIARVLSYAK